MPLDPLKMALATANGLSAICATCETFWEADDRGADSCGQACGGPVSGGDFPKYKGPLTNFAALCFVCGGKPTHAVKGNKSLRVFGCCYGHLSVIQKMKPEGKEAIDVVMKSADGKVSGSNDEAPSPDKIKLVLGG